MDSNGVYLWSCNDLGKTDPHTIRINDVKYFNLINFYVDHNLWFGLYLLGAQFYQFQKSFLPKKWVACKKKLGGTLV